MMKTALNHRCRWVSLDPAGRVVICTINHADEPFRWDLEEPGGELGDHNSNTVDGALMAHDGATWRESDPWAWEADLCGGCRGTGTLPLMPGADYYPCEWCDGSGLDLTPPPRLVDVGSRLRREGFPDVVIAGKMDDIAFCVEQDGLSMTPIELAAIGTVWAVVRAVPPAHQEARP